MEGLSPQERLLRRLVETKHLDGLFLWLAPPWFPVEERAIRWIQEIFCGSPPCGSCLACRQVARRRHADLLVLDGREGGIKVEHARHLQEWLRIRPVGQRKVALLLGADQSTPEAFASLLKILEELPRRRTAILTASQREAIPETIRSRAQILAFRAPHRETGDALVDLLEGHPEAAGLPEERLRRLFQQAQELVTRPPREALQMALESLREIAWKEEGDLYLRMLTWAASRKYRESPDEGALRQMHVFQRLRRLLQETTVSVVPGYLLGVLEEEV